MKNFLAILGLIAFIGSAQSAEFKGTARVVDGDTFDLYARSGDFRIRLCGIDAAEGRQKGGPEATQALKDLIEGKEIRCVPVGVFGRTPCDRRSKPRNRNRLVAQCFLGDKDIASEMILMDHACDWRKFSGGHYKLKPTTCVRND
jgi:micrococcal nuclease